MVVADVTDSDQVQLVTFWERAWKPTQATPSHRKAKERERERERPRQSTPAPRVVANHHQTSSMVRPTRRLANSTYLPRYLGIRNKERPTKQKQGGGGGGGPGPGDTYYSVHAGRLPLPTTLVPPGLDSPVGQRESAQDPSTYRERTVTTPCYLQVGYIRDRILEEPALRVPVPPMIACSPGRRTQLQPRYYQVLSTTCLPTSTYLPK